MNSDKEFHRRSIRLPGVDYSEPGAYFLTICAARQQQIFGSFGANRMVLSPLGEVVRECWIQIPQHFPQASLEEFVVMPNHLHGIIALTLRKRNVGPPVGARYIVPSSEKARTPERFQKPVKGSIPTIVRTFKAAVTREARVSLAWKEPIWQRDYFDRVLRNGKEYSDASRYILENPLRYKWDKENTKREPRPSGEATPQWLE